MAYPIEQGEVSHLIHSEGLRRKQQPLTWNCSPNKIDATIGGFIISTSIHWSAYSPEPLSHNVYRIVYIK